MIHESQVGILEMVRRVVNERVPGGRFRHFVRYPVKLHASSQAKQEFTASSGNRDEQFLCESQELRQGKTSTRPRYQLSVCTLSHTEARAIRASNSPIIRPQAKELTHWRLVGISKVLRVYVLQSVSLADGGPQGPSNDWMLCGFQDCQSNAVRKSRQL